MSNFDDLPRDRILEALQSAIQNLRRIALHEKSTGGTPELLLESAIFEAKSGLEILKEVYPDVMEATDK